MKKNYSVPSLLVRIVCGAALLGALSGTAVAQSFGQEPEVSRTQAAPERPSSTMKAADIYSDRGLPSISNNGRPETRDLRSPRVRDKQGNATANSQREFFGFKDDILPEDTFATFVESATGARLERFGRNLFNDQNGTFSPFESNQVNADYVIGTGDELQIRGWGMINVDVTAIVDRNGAIYIPRVGSVKVAGVKYRDLQGQLKQAIGKNFSNFELSASISQTRALQIYVTGHAARPGTYTLNSMSTLLNALFTSGGPDLTGSMRNIQLKRGGATVTTFDLYDMLVKGDKSHDATLRDGDVIYIAEVGPLVALTGNVKVPSVFELKGATSLADLLGWAGGVDSAAEQKPIIIEKTVENNYQMMAEVIGDKAIINSRLASVPVHPADLIRVFAAGATAVQAQLQNEYVRVSGEVKRSGVFRILKGETLRELMARLGGTTDLGYIYATQLKRQSVKKAQQLKLDEIADRFERELESSATARLSSTIDKDAVAIQTAEIERQRRVAEKMRTVKAEGRIVLELTDGEAELKNLPDVALQDGDSIHVPRKPGTVDVLGSVFQPNTFIFKARRNVKDYMLLAGGATSTADTDEMYVIRADGTARSARSRGWFSGLGGTAINPGDTIVVPEKLDRSNWKQSLKEWTTIFYQFGLGAAGLKVLKN